MCDFVCLRELKGWEAFFFPLTAFKRCQSMTVRVTQLTLLVTLRTIPGGQLKSYGWRKREKVFGYCVLTYARCCGVSFQLPWSTEAVWRSGR